CQSRRAARDACAQIGAGLGGFGCRYLRSKQQAEKVAGEWTQVVSFQSSDRNTASDIRLWIWYWIDSEQVRRWRRRGARTPRVLACPCRHCAGGPEPSRCGNATVL